MRPFYRVQVAVASMTRSAPVELFFKSGTDLKAGSLISHRLLSNLIVKHGLSDHTQSNPRWAMCIDFIRILAVAAERGIALMPPRIQEINRRATGP